MRSVERWRERHGRPDLDPGSVDVRVVAARTSNGVPELVVAAAGQHLTFRRAIGPDDRFAPVSVSVADPAGRLVANAYVEIREARGYVVRFVTRDTPSSGVPLPPGDATVQVAPPEAYAMAPGQSNPVIVTVGAAALQVPIVVVRRQ